MTNDMLIKSAPVPLDRIPDGFLTFDGREYKFQPLMTVKTAHDTLEQGKTLFPRLFCRPTMLGRYSSAKTTLFYGSRRFGKSRIIRAWQNAYFLHQQFPTLARYNTTLLDYAQ
jgi:hypothetical protein